jgi:hypothetical protein
MNNGGIKRKRRAPSLRPHRCREVLAGRSAVAHLVLVRPMPRDLQTHPLKRCQQCRIELSFDRSYGFHAGFSNSGFLYNDAGDASFIWSSFDPDYAALVGERHPWTLTDQQRQRIEDSLLPSPTGGAWRFSNPARCPHCRGPISGPITETIYGLAFDGRSAPDDPAVEIEVPFRTFLRSNQSLPPTTDGSDASLSG